MRSCHSPRFSIIIPTRNVWGKLEGTLPSVLTQSFADFECIVVDAASIDGTPEQLQAYSSKLRLQSEPDAGLYDAMNKGIRLARGKYLYFLGAGDRLRPEALDRMAELCPPSDRPQLVYGDVNWENVSSTYDGKFNRFKLTQRNICHQAIFYHRAIFGLVGEFNLNYPTCADYEFNLRCFGAAKIVKRHIDFVVADFEDGGQAKSIRDDVFYHDRARLVRQHLGLLPWLYLRRGLFIHPVALIVLISKKLLGKLSAVVRNEHGNGGGGMPVR